MYLIIKHTHLLFILLGFLTFFVRGILMMRQSPLVNHRAFLMGPHAINALIIGTGIYLTFILQISPSSQPWLMSKLIALVVFIGLGLLTFKHPKLQVRKIFWLLALLVFAFMVSVARSKDPLGFFAAFA